MDDFILYPKIKLIGSPENEGIGGGDLVIEEKIDGANFRFMFKDDNIIFGSRTQQMTSDEGEDSNVNKNFQRCVDYIRDTLKDVNLEAFEGLIFYGECCIVHTIQYDFDNMMPFIGFDVYDMSVGRFRADKGMLFSQLSLPTAHVIATISPDELSELSEDSVPDSKYYDGKAEGIVIKDYTNQIFAKIVRSEFKEKNVETFGGSKKWAQDGAGKVAAQYCTSARIDKCIFKLVDDGHPLAMELMKHLPTMVWEDLVEEEYHDILNSNYTIDLRMLRKIIAKRCVATLKQVIVNTGLRGRK